MLVAPTRKQICADCLVRWLDSPLLEIVARPIVPRLRNIFETGAIS
jgi:hypothetical protein